jgi:DNA-binding protein H-NS
MNNLVEIQTQIDKLQKQASDIRAKEFAKTVHEIQATMRAFGISMKDIQKGLGKPASDVKAGRPKKAAVSNTKASTDKPKRKTAGTTVAAKFRGPNGEVWSGRGLMPRWLAALVAGGKTKEDFAIAS